MAALFALVSALAFLTFVICLVLIPFKSKRTKAKSRAKWSAVVLVAATVMFGVFSEREEDQKAIAAGWSSSAQSKEAQKAGVTDPFTWSNVQKDQRLKAEADARSAVEAKAQADAVEQTRLVKFAALSVHPDDQTAFIGAIVKSRDAYHSANTDFQKGAMRPARASQICSALNGRSISNWVGKVTTLSTNSDGKGVLALEIADDVYVKTTNNALSDSIAESMIAPGSKMYSKMSVLAEGDTVKFSGSFFPSETDCVREISMTLDGSLREPEFLFRFRDVAKIVAE